MMKYIYTPFLKMFDFKGIATVKEFWIFFIFYTFLNIIFSLFLEKVFHIPLVYAIIIPFPHTIAFYALGFRRLREADFNPFLFLIPSLLVKIILGSMPSKNMRSD